jgi:succinylarginine dihydrolase
MVTYLFNGQIVAETFDKYFVSVAQNIHENNHNVNSLSNHDNPISYLFRAFNQPFPTINLKSVLSKEIEDIT